MATKQILIDIPAESEEGGTVGKYPNCYAVIPPNGKICERTGLKHAQLYKLLTGNGAARAFVRVANLKLPGAAKGKTLFHVGDMLRYLDMLAAETGMREPIDSRERIGPGRLIPGSQEKHSSGAWDITMSFGSPPTS